MKKVAHIKGEKSLLKHVASSVITRIIGIAIGMLGSILLARGLGPEGRGVVSWVMSLQIFLCVLCQIGMVQVNQRYGASHPEFASYLIKRTIRTSLLAGIIAVPIFLYFTHSYEIVNNNLPLLIIGLVMGAILATGDSLCGLLVGISNSKGYNLSNIFQKITSVGIYLIIFIFGWMTPLITMIAIGAGILTKLITAVFFLKDIEEEVVTQKTMAPNMNRFMMVQYTASLLTVFSGHIIIFLMGGMVTPEYVGFYATALVLVEASILMPQVFAMYLLPHLVSMNKELRHTASLRMVFLMLLIIIPAAYILYLLSPWLIPLLFGTEFIPSISVLNILLPGMIAQSIAVMLQARIISSHNGWHNIVAPLMAAISILIASLMLIPEYKAEGAAAAWSISGFVFFFTTFAVSFTLSRNIVNK